MNEANITGTVDTGAPPTQPTAPSAPPSAAPSAPAAPPVQEYEVKVNGQTVKVTLDEALKGYMRQSDYTRHKQGLAAQEQQLAMIPRYQEAIREAQAFLSDESRIATYYQQKFGKQLAAATEQAQDAVDAGYLTPAQAQGMLTQLRQELQQELASAFNQIQLKETTGTYKQQVDSTVQRALSTYPAIREALGAKAELAIKQLVAAQKPQSIEETVALLEEEAKHLNDQLGGFRDTALKSAVGSPDNPLTRGIEPPRGGQPPSPAGNTPTFKKVTDPSLRQLVEQDLMAAFGRTNG